MLLLQVIASNENGKGGPTQEGHKKNKRQEKKRKKAVKREKVVKKKTKGT